MAGRNRPCKVSDIPDDEILAACRDFHAAPADGGPGVAPLNRLSAKYPYKVALRKMERMAGRGLIGYGVSIRCAWVTDPKLNGGERCW